MAGGCVLFMEQLRIIKTAGRISSVSLLIFLKRRSSAERRNEQNVSSKAQFASRAGAHVAELESHVRQSSREPVSSPESVPQQPLDASDDAKPGDGDC